MVLTQEHDSCILPFVRETRFRRLRTIIMLTGALTHTRTQMQQRSVSHKFSTDFPSPKTTEHTHTHIFFSEPRARQLRKNTAAVGVGESEKFNIISFVRRTLCRSTLIVLVAVCVRVLLREHNIHTTRKGCICGWHFHRAHDFRAMFTVGHYALPEQRSARRWLRGLRHSPSIDASIAI